MSEKKINLEEIANDHGFIKGISIHSHTAIIHDKFKAAMKEAIKQTLELAAENARTKYILSNKHGGIIDANIVDKQSILNTINQVE